MSIVSLQRHCRLKHSGDVRVVIGLKEGGTVEERFMFDDGNSDVDTTSAPPGRPEGSGNCFISDTLYIEGILTLATTQIFCDVTPCCLVNCYQHFKGSSCPYLED